jgi:hypothetical protein
MTLIKNIATAIIVCLTFVQANAQVTDTSRTGLLFGKNHAYFLTAPKGWIFDDEAAREEGIKAVFYPKGENWVDAETAMYTNWAAYDTTKNEKFTDIINADINNFKTNSKGIIIKKEKVILLDKKKKAIVYSFINEKEQFFEQVAYIEEKKGAVLIILTSKTKAGLSKNNAFFTELIKSYNFLTDKVNY